MWPVGSSYTRACSVQRWPKRCVYWAPSPQNVLEINPHRFQESRRSAALYRKHVVESKLNLIKKELLKAELDNVVQTNLANSQAITDYLTTLEDLANILVDRAQQPASSNQGGARPQTDPHVPQPAPAIPSAPPKENTTTVVIAPGDSGYTFSTNFLREFLSGLYATSASWLPSYGPWFTAMTANAMQRRVFPKELKGTANLKNSTSLKLITEVLTTVASINVDFYTDLRNLSDFNAALCILNAYYCKTQGHPLPASREELLDNLGPKIAALVADIKGLGSDSNITFTFTFSSGQQAATIAPVNGDGRYNKDFFSNHKIFRLLVAKEVVLLPNFTNVPGATDGPDYIYALTSALFSDNIPPFGNYQLNLRSGIKGVEYLILVYLTLANAQLSKPDGRRLHLKALLGAAFEHSSKVQLFKRDEVFTFLMKEYVLPILSHNNNISTTELFPGMALAALEVGNQINFDPNKHFVNLAGTKFTKIFNVLNQKLMFKDVRELLVAKSELRVALENGLAATLNSIAPVNAVVEVIQKQFGGGDDYDRLYFLVLGCLPVTVAVV
ncbi:tegument protein [Alcelaphine gammaherpesvirus 1]|uniref:Capsid vertex component 2 n=1 Tax=Alcelaphine herpesvirus 1 (strain C500) TaxID=654901 RepID=CVC2_ALHV1|nr:tegument protein [Alcelaphine gammaherpesvirus 1]O36369.1 RecName: Full=Capsid vertex component 2 [Alcelaphine herpesvirus 1 strain C500]AAC58066.1 tegument protein [Alcelaphine gammaherpesvirus 1]APB09445.1 DNA packaging tegument protein UL25 [Alcelaphine gammaherpesvirus 1]APB09517.1 DNA packaging tegument protein UL25 [Alcelaphine gammaherpesvirus 1]